MNSGPERHFRNHVQRHEQRQQQQADQRRPGEHHGQHDADQRAEAEPAEDFGGRHREIGKPGIVGRAQRRDGRERRGQDEFRHLEGVDQNLPEHDHGEMHDQDDRERPCRSAVAAEHRTLLWMRARLPGRVAAIYRGLLQQSTIWLIRAAANASPDRPRACGGPAWRPGWTGPCRRSPTGSAYSKSRNS